METGDAGLPVWQAHMRDSFEYEPMPPRPPRRRGTRTRGLFAATSTKMADIAPPATAPSPPANKVGACGRARCMSADAGAQGRAVQQP